MTKVLVLWADGRSANYGVRVLAEGMRELALRAWGEATVVDFQDYGVGDSDVSFGARSIAKDLRSPSGPIRSKLRDYDVVIDSGAGDSFTDIYGLKRLASMLYAQRVAFSEQIPIAMGPQTIGPFKRSVPKALARRNLKKMDVVMARDSSSHEYARTLGRADTILTTDVVFALARERVPKVRDVIVNVSGLLWFDNSHVDSARYRSSIRALLDGLRANGRRVSLLAHVVNRVSVVDDAAAIAELMTSLPYELEVIRPDSLPQVRAAVGSANLVIGSRMHACLNALSMGTPAIPWAYSRKFEPLLRDIGWRHGYDLRGDKSLVTSTLQDAAEHSDAWLSELDEILHRADKRLGLAVTALREMYDAP